MCVDDLQALLNPVELQVDTLRDPLYQQREVEVKLLRLDQIDNGISGNKWYKLQHYLLTAKQQGYQQVLSFGGIWSNHIHALACAGARFGLKTVGIIRGEPESASNAMLTDARRWGMRLQFVSRLEYRQRHEPNYLQSLQRQWPHALLVPEGGAGVLAMPGLAGLVTQIQAQQLRPDYLITACGTGGTLAGLVAVAPASWRVLGVAALKGAGFLYDDIQALLAQAGAIPQAHWCIDLEGHQRGYARTTPELLAFMSAFEQRHAILLEQVYTGKMLLRLHQLIENSTFAPGSRILALHSGGLQGRRGLDPAALATL
ncbi:MAG: pyridoxal-phosphate dependent enzyme [Marinobacterium sp.]|nr:pyridoxal-phosphate dependent enzyme [Marinobacterium sp.]